LTVNEQHIAMTQLAYNAKLYALMM